MSKRIRASWWVGIAAVLLLAPLAAFSQNQVSLELLDGGNNGSMGGVYVGPYDASVNQSKQSTQIICDDFEHEVTPGESWTATVTSVSSLATNGTAGLNWGSTLAGADLGGAMFSSLQGYYAMAELATQLLTANSNQASYLAYAIWAVFDGNAVQSWIGSHGGFPPGFWAAVQSMALTALQGSYNSSTFAGWEILTAVSGTQSAGNGPPQEFFVFVPEGGTALMYLLLAGFACFGTMYFKSRRRHATSLV